MKKILFPTDFSKAAEQAFIYALNVAKALDAQIVTLHVYARPDLRGVHLPNTLQEIYEDIQLEEFENYHDKVPYLHQIAEKNNLGNIGIQHMMMEGDTVASILSTAKQESVDLIIMGTKGATGFREVFLGSIAAKVLEDAEFCPVLAVPEKAVFDGKINKIAVTTAFEEKEKEAIQYLLNFAKLFKAHVYCVHVDLSHMEVFAQRMKKFKKAFEPSTRLHFEVLDGIDIEKTISKWLIENKIDMLGMLTHKRTFWESLFSHRMTKQMVNHIDTPILSIQTEVLKMA